MTNINKDNGDRLDRIEVIVESNCKAIADTKASIEQLATVAQAALSISQKNREGLQLTEQLIKRNAASIDRLDEKMEQYITEGKKHREFIATQIDGIKIETRRIVEHLFSNK